MKKVCHEPRRDFAERRPNRRPLWSNWKHIYYVMSSSDIVTLHNSEDRWLMARWLFPLCAANAPRPIRFQEKWGRPLVCRAPDLTLDFTCCIMYTYAQKAKYKLQYNKEVWLFWEKVLCSRKYFILKWDLNMLNRSTFCPCVDWGYCTLSRPSGPAERKCTMSDLSGDFNNAQNPFGCGGAPLPEDEYGTYPVDSLDIRVKLTPLNEILKTIPLEEFLIKDKANAKELEKNLLWFHGKITRETAVHILQENGNTEGLFLVRESTTAPGDFVVSLVHDDQPQHFQIHCLGDFYYQVDNGPLFHGLDALVNFYMEAANGLSTRLEEFCKGEVPPAMARRQGRTTPLHR